MSKSKYKTIDGYYKETQLYKRGWQKADIAEFLTKNNCRMKYDSIMQYYYIDDVHNAEETYFIEGNPRMGKYSGKDYRDTACRFIILRGCILRLLLRRLYIPVVLKGMYHYLTSTIIHLIRFQIPIH